MDKQHCAICDKDELIIDNGESICLSCGYMTNSTLTLDTEQWEEFEKKSHTLISEIKQLDKKNNCYWYPSIVDFYKNGIVFPHGTKNDWVWAFAPYIPIPLIERIKMPVPGAKDLYYEYKADLSKLKTYERLEFRKALENLGEIYE